MADDPRPLLNPLAAWGSILASARSRLTTAQVWDAIRTAFPREQYRYGSDILGAVNRMRARATGLAETSRLIAKANRGDVLGGRMIGQQIYARSLNDQEKAPVWHVRFQVPVTTPDGTSTDWYTMEYNGVLPATVGDLYDDLDAYADSLGDDYGVSVGAIGAVEFGAL